MDRERQDPRNTREFVALWNEAKEEHVVQRVDDALAGLSRRGLLPSLTAEQREMLAHAVQLAADPAVGPSGALQYLETYGSPSRNAPGA